MNTSSRLEIELARTLLRPDLRQLILLTCGCPNTIVSTLLTSRNHLSVLIIRPTAQILIETAKGMVRLDL